MPPKRMKKIFSRVFALAAFLLLGLLPGAYAAPQSLLDDTGTLLEDAESARDMAVRRFRSDEAGTHGVARFRGLNKLTARTEKFTATQDTPARFSTLEVRLFECWQTAPGEAFEAKALVGIWENRPQFSRKPASGREDKAKIIARRKLFKGWMVASSPGLSGLEHPVYDVTLLGCGN